MRFLIKRHFYLPNSWVYIIIQISRLLEFRVQMSNVKCGPRINSNVKAHDLITVIQALYNFSHSENIKVRSLNNIIRIYLYYGWFDIVFISIRILTLDELESWQNHQFLGLVVPKLLIFNDHYETRVLSIHFLILHCSLESQSEKSHQSFPEASWWNNEKISPDLDLHHTQTIYR